ncbi:hypothetical protein [Amycolatopsis sp. BJA-103]|uniref:hypothetical protein n=1 Tax=Amycolatopsis sp. BJA-103 TaxID=1911175 RepID=UPI000C77D40E|nr:hypothetical protein [Amycolatopsis sp. BJA-103]AUI56788.1 hypothetical protein BKN51_00215 [Amycolatopsis sp. BJA-103]PNE13109.1 hypothetical protein B1H26_42355 [Amycolatopsis sp. BJA-103]
MDLVWLKGEGGAVRRYALPLHETIAERVERGDITRVNKDGTPYVESAEPARLKPKQKLQAEARELGVDDSGTADEITARIDARRELLTQAAELGVETEGSDDEIRARIDEKLAQ